MVKVAPIAFTYVEQLSLNLAGPLVAAALAYVIAERVTRKNQQRREDHDLRERLTTEATQSPYALYLATQQYWRAQNSHSGDALTPYREALDVAYLESRAEAKALEHRLKLRFADPHPSQLMHRAMDLLTVRYFHLITTGGATTGLRQKNAGPEHADLGVEELADPQAVLQKYHATLAELVVAVQERPLRAPA